MAVKGKGVRAVSAKADQVAEAFENPESGAVVSGRWIMDGAATPIEAAERLENFARYLRNIAAHGYTFEAPVDNDHAVVTVGGRGVSRAKVSDAPLTRDELADLASLEDGSADGRAAQESAERDEENPAAQWLKDLLVADPDFLLNYPNSRLEVVTDGEINRDGTLEGDASLIALMDDGGITMTVVSAPWLAESGEEHRIVFTSARAARIVGRALLRFARSSAKKRNRSSK